MYRGYTGIHFSLPDVTDFSLSLPEYTRIHVTESLSSLLHVTEFTFSLPGYTRTHFFFTPDKLNRFFINFRTASSRSHDESASRNGTLDTQFTEKVRQEGINSLNCPCCPGYPGYSYHDCMTILYSRVQIGGGNVRGVRQERRLLSALKT